MPYLAAAEISTSFIDGGCMGVEAITTFTADLNDRSTGLESLMSVSLWFVMMPYSNRGINPNSDKLSVSLKMENSALYSWRGYPVDLNDDSTFFKSEYDTYDARNIWFNDIYAQLRYENYWLRIAGLKPEIQVTQASMFSVFDRIMAGTTEIDKNNLPLPLFYKGNWYDGTGIVSVIGRDLLYITNIANIQQVPVGGMLSAGLDSRHLNLDTEAGSWLPGKENNLNAWVYGLNLNWRPDLFSTFKVNALAAINFSSVVDETEGVDTSIINQDPLALGIGCEIHFELPYQMVLKPVIGIDLFYEQTSKALKWETGGGFKFFFRGTDTKYCRNIIYGGTELGDIAGDVGLFIAANINQDNQVNGLVSFNEDPAQSLIPNLGGYAQIELMNITSTGGHPFLLAAIVQIEYSIGKIFTPYISEKYIPGDLDNKIYSNDTSNFTSKAGVRIAPFDNFIIDVWYERNDRLNNNAKDEIDNGIVQIKFMVYM